MNQSRFFSGGAFVGYPVHNENDPAHVLACPSCKRKKRKYQEPDWPEIEDTQSMSGWPCGHSHPDLAGVPAHQLAYGRPPAPGVCCQLDPAGNIVCSDGMIYPPNCPKCPDPNVPGVAEYDNDNGILRPRLPSPGSCVNTGAAATGQGGLLMPLVLVAGIGVLGYYLLK